MAKDYEKLIVPIILLVVGIGIFYLSFINFCEGAVWWNPLSWISSTLCGAMQALAQTMIRIFAVVLLGFGTYILIKRAL